MGGRSTKGSSIAENEYVRVTRSSKEVSIHFKKELTFVLNKPHQADIDVFMVWLQSCFNEEGRKIITLRETAEFFGYKNRQDIDNRMQLWRKAGETILGVITPWTERKWLLTPELRLFIFDTWIDNLHYTAADIHREMIEGGFIEPEQSIPRSTIYGAISQVDFNYARKKLLKRLNNGTIHYSKDWVLQNLFALLEKQDELLQEAGVQDQAICFEKEKMKQAVVSHKPEESAEDATGKKSPSSLSSELIENFLFNPSWEQQWETIARRCPDCHSDNTSRKTSQEKVIHIGKKKTNQMVEKRYCNNPECPRKVFSTSPDGSKMVLTFSFLLATCYIFFRSSFGKIATYYEISKSQVYKRIIIFGMSATIFKHTVFKPRFSGVVSIDEKWIKVPKHFRGKTRKRKYLYFYVAVDPFTLDLLHSDVFETNDSVSTKTFLWGLRVKGYIPKVITTDGLKSYLKAIPEVFPHAIHQLCLFHLYQNNSDDLKKIFGKNYHEVECTIKVQTEIHHIFDCKDRRTCYKRYNAFMSKREHYLAMKPELSKIFNRLQKGFTSYVHAIGSSFIPKTNNAAELVIKQFNYHYKNMAGFESLETAKIQTQLFELIYRFTPFTCDARREFRNKCPLEIAGYDVKDIPIYNYLRTPIIDKTKEIFELCDEKVMPLLKAA